MSHLLDLCSRINPATELSQVKIILLMTYDIPHECILGWGKVETGSYVTEAGLEPTRYRMITLNS